MTTPELDNLRPSSDLRRPTSSSPTRTPRRSRRAHPCATTARRSPTSTSRPEIVEALAAVGIVKTFAIQELTLPIALAGQDLIGQARTGTGKTLGFGVPLLNRLELPGGDAAAPQALVIAPTRELAVQVSGDLKSAGSKLGARVLTIYGGRAYEPQIEALRKGIEVVVGTPGRLLDLAQQGHLVLGAVRTLVLDEADEMLDLGFLPDIEKLLKMVPGQAADDAVLGDDAGPDRRAGADVPHPARCRSAPSTAPTTPSTDHVEQFAYRAHALDKAEVHRPRAAGPQPRPDADLRPHQAVRRQALRRPRATAASPSAPCTATSARVRASRRCARSAPARSTSSSPPTSRPAGWTSRASRTS